MCGIFGYFCRTPVSMNKVLKLLQLLEKHKYEGEGNPVGGHGAGVGFVDDSGKMKVYKVGKINASPARALSKIKKIAQVNSTIVLGHVRHASKDFLHTVKYQEAAQPYKANCLESSEIMSAHNGFVENHEEIRESFLKHHHFESEKMAFVDSETIPHLFQERLIVSNDEIKAREYVFKNLRGNNTVVLLSATKSSRFLHVIHKGHTRGMHVWKNDQGEIVLCSREEPLRRVFGELLKEGNFKKDLSIEWKNEREEKRIYEILSADAPMKGDKHAELPNAHLLQVVYFILFSLVWVLDSFVFNFSIFLTNFIPSILRGILGLGVLALGFGITAWGHWLLFNKKLWPDLATIGIFAYVRHPMYLGYILAYLGCIIGTMSLLSIIVWLLIIRLYSRMANYEEQKLEQKFGKRYVEYKEKVPKWVF